MRRVCIWVWNANWWQWTGGYMSLFTVAETQITTTKSVKSGSHAAGFVWLSWYWALGIGFKLFHVKCKILLQAMGRLIGNTHSFLWKENSWIWHHYHAPSHEDSTVNVFLNKHPTAIMEAPYLQDLLPVIFFSQNFKSHFPHSAFSPQRPLRRICWSSRRRSFQMRLKDALTSELFIRICCFQCRHFEGDKINLNLVER